MKNLFKRIDNFYDNHKWFRIVLKVFEIIIFYVVLMLAIIGLLVLKYFPFLSNNNNVEYDFSQIRNYRHYAYTGIGSGYEEGYADNLASPDLTDKEYLGDGEYQILDSLQGDLKYNVFSGVWTYNQKDSFTQRLNDFFLNLSIFEPNINYYIKPYYISGDTKIEVQYRNTLGKNNTVENGVINDNEFSYNGIRVFNITGDFTPIKNYQFKLQIEKGDTATTYQTPIGALKQHSLLEYEKGYNDGFNDGYIEGLDEGLKSVFDNNNMLINSIKMGKNTTAPDNRFFGFKIVLPEPIYINNIDIIGLEKYHELLDLDILSSSANVPQGVVLTLGNTHSIHLAFKDFTDSKNYEMITSVKNNQEKLIDTIVIALAVSNTSMPSHEFERLQDDIYNNVGVYINNTVLSNEAMEHYFNKYYTEGYYDAKEEQEDLIEQAYNKGKNEGYNEGLNANPNNHWSDLLFTIFGAFGTILGIELLPGWSIGIIIGIPIVFGIIYFIIGRKKD